MMIPLVAALWEDINFQGRKRVFVSDAPNLILKAFHATISSIEVHPGPDYIQWKKTNGGTEPSISFFQDINFGGESITLTVREYPDIHDAFDFGDLISSVKFNSLPQRPNAISPISLVVELFNNKNYSGSTIVIVEDSSDIPTDFLSEFNYVVRSVIVTPGPYYTAGDKAQLFRDINWGGGHIDLYPGSYPDIQASHGFYDIARAIKINPPYKS